MKIQHVLAVTAATALVAAPASAQVYPGKPIKIIVSTSPGGITDIAARILGAHITARTGQPHVIDNRAGGSGNIAMDAVTKAAPDGTTLGFANTGNITVNPYLFRHMTFDPLNDLIPIGPVGTVPLFLVINGKVPAKTLKEFIAYAKANPDKVSYAAAGAGTTPDLTGGEFARRAGLDKLVFVPFRARCACSPPRRRHACPMCPTSRLSPKRDFPASKCRPGSRCSRRAARPRRSSTSSMAIRGACTTIRSSRSGSSRASWTR